MVLKLNASLSAPPFGAVFTCGKCSVPVEWGSKTSLPISNSLCLTLSHGISRHLARVNPSLDLYPTDILHRTEVDHWLTVASGPMVCNDLDEVLKHLNKALAPASYLVGNSLTLADLEVFGALYRLNSWETKASDKGLPHVLRWYRMMHKELDSIIATLPDNLNVSAVATSLTTSAKVKQEDRGKFVELPDAKMGEVVVRFPPEASGYLHIGHAKAALLNQHYQNTFKGKLIMRFDDTNPEKESAEYEKVILEDLKLLNIVPDKFSHTSDYFDMMLEMCENLLKSGLAYVDDTDPEIMKKEREERKESKNRNLSVQENLSRWAEMKDGSTFGQKCCVRAKIDMTSVNGCMRDPTIYRCKTEPHIRTGHKYKVYPIYDFACPIVDSVEGVTHALRTTEYHDRDEQYFWFIEKLGLRKLHIYEYSRLNMNNTVLSKRKLTWFVKEGLVDGWNDPRFPTVRGVLRRGMTVEGLKDFIIAQGSSRAVVNMEWDKIWAFNKKVIDRDSCRYTSLQGDLVPVYLSGVQEEKKMAQLHPKVPAKGMKPVWVGPKVWIESADAVELKEGHNATFINWGNIMIKKIVNVEGKIVSVEAEPNLSNVDFKKTLKLTWLADNEKSPFTPVICVHFDHLITKSVLGKDEDFKSYIGHETRFEVTLVGDHELKQLKEGEIIQLQRKGFFRVDEPYMPISLSSCRESPLVLFSIPDGHTKEMPSTAAVKKQAGMSTKEKVHSSEGKVAEKSPIESEKESMYADNSCNILEMDKKIREQGDKVRKLKADKVDSTIITAEVSVLKSLKKQFMDASGMEWKPDIDLLKYSAKDTGAVVLPSIGKSNALELHNNIKQQGDKVRKLKNEKADKDVIKGEVNILLALKEEFKCITNVDWKPELDINKLIDVKSEIEVDNGKSDSVILSLHSDIKVQGDKIRTLKSAKASKDEIKVEVDVLLALKSKFKEVTNMDWIPDIDINKVTSFTSEPITEVPCSKEVLVLHHKIKKQGDKVRLLKNSKSDKGEIKAEVSVLLDLKRKFYDIAKVEWKPDIDITSLASSPVVVSEVEEEPKPETGSTTKKQTRLGIEVKKNQNFPEWYSQVITKSEMIEYYNVSGCYILRPWSYAIWDFIKEFFDKEIKKIGVENSYFPMFVSKESLEKEKTHITDFSPEVAWVTKCGSNDMAEPVAIRPTSETVMYPSVAKWVQSHRDLPIKLNQWNSVVRWEFKQPTPFLRTREFLWQEGHTSHATKADAEHEVYHILDLYREIYEDLLAIPVVKGRKTEKEKFAGSEFSTTTEAYICATGRGIQGATSHHLGQNFSRMFDISFEHPETKEREFAFQNSWGITTRTIGVMVMVHGDDKGLVLPPKVAAVQTVIVPVGITAKTSEQEKDVINDACKGLEKALQSGDIRAKCDLKDNVTPAWKFNHWELKGVPLRLEVGPREVASGQVFAVRRDTGEKQLLKCNAVEEVGALLKTIQDALFSKALVELQSHIKLVKVWQDFCNYLDGGNLLHAPFCGEIECEDNIKKDSARDEVLEPGAPSMGGKGLCIPFDQPGSVEDLLCIHPACQKPAKFYTLFGRSY